MDATQGLLISTARSDNQVVIRVRGDLDYAATPRFVEAVESAMDDDVPLYLIDCKHVTFIDSESLKAILRLRNQLNESCRTVRLRNCSKPVTRILRLLDLESDLCLA